ncbi:MAG: hypothetical protein H7222_14440 [Methylotenera sp.]|nr:hypothetical protein [Oligoflexia bacterium]
MTKATPSGYTVPQLAQDRLDFRRAKRVRSATLVAHSLAFLILRGANEGA